MNFNITLGDFLTLLVLIVSGFNSYQHMSQRTRVLELKLWVTDKFVSKKFCEEARRLRQMNGGC